MTSAVIEFEDGAISVHSSPTKKVGKIFSSGFYEAFPTQQGLSINKRKLEELHKPFNSTETSLVLKTVSSFFKDGVKERVNALGYTHKLGVLVHGKQGCGKTALLNYISNSLVERRDAIVLFCNDSNTLGGAIGLARSIRDIQKNPIIFIADEFERYASNAESEMKNLLDGKDSVENSLFLAATNYLDRVPDTIKDRPSRFKVVQELKGITDKNAMKQVFSNINSKSSPRLLSDSDIDKIVNGLEEVTLDEIKHIVLDKLTDNYLPKQVSRRKIGFSTKDEEIKYEPYDGNPQFIWLEPGQTKKVVNAESNISVKDNQDDSDMPF